MLEHLKQKIRQSFSSVSNKSNAERKRTPKELEDLFSSCVLGDFNAYAIVMEQAKTGDPKAQEIAGRIYFGGQCVSVDYSQATYWWRKAAEQGHADSQCSLAINYKDGFGVEQDLQKAKEWFLKAATGGSSFAMNSLAEMYRTGDGFEIDEKQALYWFMKGGEAGDVSAQHSTAVCFGTGFGTGIDHAKALEWGLLSAQGGYSEGERFVACCYLNGDGVEKNPEIAIEWFKKSANQGNIDSIYSLGIIYARDLEPESELIEIAKLWLSKGAELGDDRCAKELARLIEWENE